MEDIVHVLNDSLDVRCPLCGEPGVLEFCDPSGIAVCSRCAMLLFRFQGRLASLYGARLDSDGLKPDTSFDDLGADSLDKVELIMELEEEFDVTIPDDAVERFKTIGDVMRWIFQRAEKKCRNSR